MTADVALVVTAHDETVVSGPTMHSADRAVAVARAAGLTVRAVVALDAATDTTRTYFAQPCFAHWDHQVHAEGDPGLVRSSVVRGLDCRYVAFLDAGDLLSENWLAAGVAALDEAGRAGERAVAHPELDVAFDGARAIQVGIDQRSPLFTPHYLYLRPYYGSLCLAPPEAHLELPGPGRDVPDGLSDRGLGSPSTIESLDAGWRHLVVPDTIGFTRRRDDSLGTGRTQDAAVVRAVPGLAIDRVRDLGR